LSSDKSDRTKSDADDSDRDEGEDGKKPDAEAGDEASTAKASSAKASPAKATAAKATPKATPAKAAAAKKRDEDDDEDDGEDDEDDDDDGEGEEEEEKAPGKKADETPYRGSGPSKGKPAKEPAGLWTRAAARWAAISLVLTLFYVVYTKHPYYLRDQFSPWRPIFRTIFIGWLALGLPYVVAALKEFTKRSLWFTDVGLHFLLMGRWALKRFQRKHSSHLWRSKRLRNTLRSIAVKAFFTPLMTTFLSGHLNSVSNHWLRKKGVAPFNFGSSTTMEQWWATVKAKLPLLVPSGSDWSALVSPSTWSMADMRWGLDMAYDFVFIVDCGIATMGYLSESRFLGNKTKSAEPTGLGWMVAIGCYPPFNQILGTYMPLGGGHRIISITDEKTLLVFKALTVLLFSIYASATVAFGFKFSNLTNRGIITRGPYAFIRHPAYVTKCLAWWLEHIPGLSLETAFFLCGTCSVYAMRAWTEERHLSMDAAYRAYKKKVPWVAIPRIF